MLTTLYHTFNRWFGSSPSARRARRPRLTLETLQERLAPAVSLVNGQVIIEGAAGNDVAAVGATATQVSVILNGQLFNFNRAAVVGIAFVGAAGDDICLNTTTFRLVAAGGDGNDKLTGGAGDDLMDGGEGNDILEGNAGNDILYGSGGNDAFLGGDGTDVLDGGDGNDVMNGQSGHDAIYGRAGADVIAGDIGNDYLDGGDGNDLIYGQDGDDVISAGANDDVIFGGNGNDYILGGLGNDAIAAEAGNDIVNAQDGNDFSDGGDGIDALVGEAGDDFLRGGLGNDGLNGGAGNDILEGGVGQDGFIGGVDNDFSDRRSDDVFDLETERHKYRATLTGTGLPNGQAEFEALPSVGSFPFQLSVSGLTAGQTMTVLVDNLAVGGFSVSSNGTGNLQLNNAMLSIQVGTQVKVRNSAGVVLFSGTFTANP